MLCGPLPMVQLKLLAEYGEELSSVRNLGPGVGYSALYENLLVGSWTLLGVGGDGLVGCFLAAGFYGVMV